MLVIIAILLVFGVVVRHKWRNAAARTEEILKLVAAEESEISKLQASEDYNSMLATMTQPVIISQGDKKYYCAVCYCPTTTRCSQCKAVRYCSGKCQITHWRQGHKDECRPANALPASKEGGSVVGIASDSLPTVNLNTQASDCSNITQEHEDSGSSSGSSTFFSFSEKSETSSSNASNSEILDFETPGTPDKETSDGSDSHILLTTSDSDGGEVSSPSSSVHPEKITPLNENIEKNSSVGTDERLHSESIDNKRKDATSRLQKSVPNPAEVLGRSHVSTSRETSSAEHQKHHTLPSISKAMKSVSVRDSGSRQSPNLKMSTNFSKSLKTPPSDAFWVNGSKLYDGKESRSIASQTVSNHHNTSSKAESNHNISSETDVDGRFPQPSSRGLKTSVQKFVLHLKVPKQVKPSTLDLRCDTGGNYSQKAIFPIKLFMQLYSCDDLGLYPFGLVNCGNSCYANAVLQCLIFTRPLSSYLLQGLHRRTCRKSGWCFICEFGDLIQKGHEMKSPLSPVGLLSKVQAIGKEEDAHEFLRNVVDKMQSVCLEEAGVSDTSAEDSTLVGLTFGGYLRSKIKCMRCSVKFERRDRMMDLTVEIDGNIYTLEDALAQFTTSETLGGDDKYKCSRCKSYEKAKKKLTVLEAPNILTVVLKRFRSGNLDKLNKIVRFPESLNLSPYTSGKSDRYPMYTLYAVVVHLGVMNAADTGHYISYVKDFQGDWFRIDDSRIYRVDIETVLSVEAYMLFYARDTPRGASSVADASTSSDGKTKRDVESISSSSGLRKKSTKTKLSATTQLQESEASPHWMSPNDFTGNHAADGWGYRTTQGNPILVDSSSDSSSIFSTSDSGSYSTDSTKESNAEEISGYLFGSRWYNP